MNSPAIAAVSSSLLEAMMSPDFYPNPCDRVTHKETHISHLFFAGDLVYKVKKQVRFSFLDYSSLAKRRHYLQEERSEEHTSELQSQSNLVCRLLLEKKKKKKKKNKKI